MQALCYFLWKKEEDILQLIHVKYLQYNFLGCILNPGHGKIPAPDFNFYMQKDKYPI